MVSHLSLLAVFTTFVAVTIGQKCYGLDGSALDSTYAPCNPSAKHSGCCATKQTDGSADICLDNGLCMTTKDEEMGMIWQSGCTDATGQDVACRKMCPGMSDDVDGLTPVSAWNIQTCDYGRYCCRAINDRRSCCGDATAPKITTTYIGAFISQTTTATSVTATGEPTRLVATAVSTGNAVDATVAPRTGLCKKEKQTTAIVGGSIGGVFGAIIIGLAGTIYWMYKRERRQRRLKEHYEEQFSQTNAYRKALASTAGSIRGSMYVEDIS